MFSAGVLPSVADLCELTMVNVSSSIERRGPAIPPIKFYMHDECLAPSLLLSPMCDTFRQLPQSLNRAGNHVLSV